MLRFSILSFNFLIVLMTVILKCMSDDENVCISYGSIYTIRFLKSWFWGSFTFLYLFVFKWVLDIKYKKNRLVQGFGLPFQSENLLFSSEDGSCWCSSPKERISSPFKASEHISLPDMLMLCDITIQLLLANSWRGLTRHPCCAAALCMGCRSMCVTTKVGSLCTISPFCRWGSQG